MSGVVDGRSGNYGAAAPADDWIEVGLIRSAHGLRGEVKVEPLTDSPRQRLGTAGDRCGASTKVCNCQYPMITQSTVSSVSRCCLTNSVIMKVGVTA